MATNFTRPDPSSAASVSSAQFNTTRRGFDQSEVRDFLRMVAAELARLQERERHLERELKSAQTTSKGQHTTFDDETATRLLGEEAAHILQAAREAASQIRNRTEEGAARLLREATEESHRLREEAEIEAARRRQDATTDAESEVSAAKQQGRDMVNEARAYRERVLAELAKRRETAVAQIEQLVHGRDRLMQAFERARNAAVDVMSDLGPLNEPDEMVNLAPITGPIPIVVSTQRLLAVATPASTERVVSLPTAMENEGNSDDEPDREPAQVVSIFAGEMSRPYEPKAMPVSEPEGESDPMEAEGEPPAENPSVEELFARLRSARTEDIVVEQVDTIPESEMASETAAVDAVETSGSDPQVAADSGQPDGATDTEIDTAIDADAAIDVDTDTETEPDSDVGDEQVTPLIVAAARKLKRVLADEQNEVLDKLRRKEQIRSLDALLPSGSEHAARYVDAVRSELVAAAIAGAQGDRNGGDPAIVRPACDVVAAQIVTPLRERLARCIDDADGSNADIATQARSVYREWKVNQIDEHLDETVRLAFARGALMLTAR